MWSEGAREGVMVYMYVRRGRRGVRECNRFLSLVRDLVSGVCTHTHTCTHAHMQQGQRLAAKSLHQQVQKSANDFNELSQNILERLQEYRDPPRPRESLSHGYLVGINWIFVEQVLANSPQQWEDKLLCLLTTFVESLVIILRVHT